MRTKVAVLVIGLLSGAINAALAQSKPEVGTSSAKQQVVFRMVELTYVASETCKQASQERRSEYQAQLVRLNTIHPKLVRAVIDSPYYAVSRESFDKTMRDLPADSARYDNSCKAYAWLLKASLDDPEGQRTLKAFQDILAK